jgi:hypothetical protein
VANLPSDVAFRCRFSRRVWLSLASAGTLSIARAYAREFWDSKDPGEWNSDEIARLLTKSPWAKATTAQRTQTVRPAVPRMPGTRRLPAERNVTTYKGTVVWESAPPVRAALKTNLPEGFDGQYVLGVSGVLLTRSDTRNSRERLRQVTTLQCKGRLPAGPATVQEDTSNGTVYLFGFSREAVPLTKNDKEVVFTTHMGRLAFTARFNPKDMLYRGELAV